MVYNKRMKTVSEFIAAVGSKAIQERVSVNASAVSNAASRGEFPPAWFKGLSELANDNGIELPDGLFPWREGAA